MFILRKKIRSCLFLSDFILDPYPPQTISLKIKYQMVVPFRSDENLSSAVSLFKFWMLKTLLAEFHRCWQVLYVIQVRVEESQHFLSGFQPIDS